MTIDERLRLSIHSKLTDLIGQDEADAVIAHIRPVPWNDVATKDDIQLVRNEMTVTRAELRSEIAELRTEFCAGIAELRTDMSTGLADVRIEVHQAIVGQTRWLIGYLTALSVVMLTVARLIF